VPASMFYPAVAPTQTASPQGAPPLVSQQLSGLPLSALLHSSAAQSPNVAAAPPDVAVRLPASSTATASPHLVSARPSNSALSACVPGSLSGAEAVSAAGNAASLHTPDKRTHVDANAHAPGPREQPQGAQSPSAGCNGTAVAEASAGDPSIRTRVTELHADGRASQMDAHVTDRHAARQSGPGGAVADPLHAAGLCSIFGEHAASVEVTVRPEAGTAHLAGPVGSGAGCVRAGGSAGSVLGGSMIGRSTCTACLPALPRRPLLRGLSSSKTLWEPRLDTETAAQSRLSQWLQSPRSLGLWQGAPGARLQFALGLVASACVWNQEMNVSMENVCGS
jgi:hypothetical protein